MNFKRELSEGLLPFKEDAAAQKIIARRDALAEILICELHRYCAWIGHYCAVINGTLPDHSETGWGAAGVLEAGVTLQLLC